MADAKGGAEVGRSALTFEEFVDAALGAAIRATAKHGGTGGTGHLPWPIWVGIVAGPFDKGQFGGGGSQQ